ncbi:MAG: hypothetical protein ABI051_17160 [Vicinamibacterales bacterium]
MLTRVARAGPWRRMIGPVLFGLAAWCAAGTVALADPVASTRVAVLARWWWLPLFVGAAAGVRPFRTSFWNATPALLATVAYWPIPLSPPLLLWTGRLAWLPVLVTLAAVVVPAGTGEENAPDTVPEGRVAPRRSLLLAALFSACLSVVVAWSLHSQLPRGDEWHYLMMTQSLRKDGDLRIENNHVQRDYESFYAGTLPPDFLRRGTDGQIYSIHAPGVAVLVLPLFALFGYAGAQASLIVVAAAAGALVWLIGWRAAADRRAAWFAWASVAGSVPFLFQSVTVFPDMFGALAVAGALAIYMALSRPGTLVGSTTLVAPSLLLAALPWFHTRFVILSVTFGTFIAWRVLTDSSRATPVRARRVALLLAVPAVSAASWFLFFYLIYGTPNPLAPYGDQPGTRWGYIPGALAGLWLDQQFGLLTYAPVLALAGWGWWRRLGAGCYSARAGAAALLLYAAAVGTYWMWWGGVPATPARFLTAVLPVLAPPVAVAWTQMDRSGRAMAVVLLALSVTMSIVTLGVDHGALAWNVRGTQAEWLVWLRPSADIQHLWPSFFWRLTPGEVRTELWFGVHALLWLMLFAATAWLVSVLARKRSTAAQILAAWWVPLTLMLAALVWWPLTGSVGIRAESSQMGVLHAMAQRGRVAIRVVPGARWTSATLADVHVRIPILEVSDDTPVPAAVVRGVPPGQYDLRVRNASTDGGMAAIALGTEPRTYRTVPLATLSGQAYRLSLPAGAERLTVRIDRPTGDLASLYLVPVALGRQRPARAIAVQRYGDTDVFFCDDQVFIEPDGFWVKGGRSGRILIAPSGASRVVNLELGNGPAENRVRLETAGGTSEVVLAASAVTRISLPLDDEGAAWLGVTSAAQFRPSATTPGGDDRLLGVRVRVVP